MRAGGWTFGFALGFVLAAGAPGCSDGGANNDCYPGSEACTCVAPDQCAAGLSCVSGFCVSLSSEGGNDSSDQGEGDGDAGDGDGDGDGDAGGGDLCQLLIECAKEVQPEALSGYATLYGPGGECYEIQGLTQEDCWAECDAIRKSLAEASPEVEACRSYNCGDGKLNADEMCDGTDDCTATCRFSDVAFDVNECNPVTQAHCDPSSERCLPSTSNFESSYFFCADNFTNDSTAKLNESCIEAAECADPSHLCIARADCVDERCCTATCYLGATDEDFAECPPGYSCTPVPTYYEYPSWPSGTELFGLCL